MKVAFPNGGRRLNDELLRDLMPIFRDTLASFGGQFEGFTDPALVVDDEEEEDDDGDGTYSPNRIEQEDPGDDTNPVVLGPGSGAGPMLSTADVQQMFF